MSLTVRFTEEMKGFFLPSAPAYDTGFENGRALDSPLMFHLTIRTADVSAFLRDPLHTARAGGWLVAPRLGMGQLPVEEGTFNLFVPGSGPGRFAMRYQLWFRGDDDAPRTMIGVKDVGNDPGFDAWSDTTSLRVQILDGHVTELSDEPYGRGILHLTPTMFLHQLSTFRGDVLGVARFGGFFTQCLAGEYLVRRRAQGRQR